MPVHLAPSGEAHYCAAWHIIAARQAQCLQITIGQHESLMSMNRQWYYCSIEVRTSILIRYKNPQILPNIKKKINLPKWNTNT